MKKLDVLKILAFCLIFALATNVKLAVAEELDTESSPLVKETDNYTFGEIEEILLSYLKSKGNEFEVGSKQYNEFIVEQYTNETDLELLKIADYKALNAYMSEYLYQLTLFEANNQSNVSTFTNNVNFDLESIKDVTIGELKLQIANEEAAVDSIKNDSLSSTFATYNVANAKNYASRWYNGRNPAYPVFTLDCTNFVSQILFAGGMKMNFNTSNGWYANTSDNSVSWSAVPEFYTYWAQTKSTVTSPTKSTIISDAKAGDIIQLKKDGATRWSHSMFVYEKSNSTLYLSAHTSDILRKDFKTVSTDYTNFRVIKM